MPYLTVIKLFKALLRFNIVDYYRGTESSLEGVEIVLYRITACCILLIY